MFPVLLVSPLVPCNSLVKSLVSHIFSVVSRESFFYTLIGNSVSFTVHCFVSCPLGSRRVWKEKFDDFCARWFLFSTVWTCLCKWVPVFLVYFYFDHKNRSLLSRLVRFHFCKVQMIYFCSPSCLHVCMFLFLARLPGKWAFKSLINKLLH